MKNAIIYTRVSTDEQAEKGFSLRYQEETLNRYCSLKNINVIKHFQDDFSAKTFNRPKWNDLMLFVKANRRNIDSVLFAKWDRFSRNTGEAYQVINTLRKMGVSVNSIEQPLDFEQPDSKIMLAIYLAVPEVENDKISMRTTEGSRKANQEGCFTSTAPVGYKNQRTPEGKASLAFSDRASLVKETFQLIAETRMTVEEARRLMLKKGLKVGKSTYYRMIRNPVYIGKIVVPAFKDQDEQIVEGLHDAIVSESLFHKAQETINGRKRKITKSKTKDEMLPLRGHVTCPSCNGNFTGSASTGRHKVKYYYYHCREGCKERVKRADAHNMLEAFLSNLVIDQGAADLYFDILKEQYGANKGSKTKKINQIKTQIQETRDIIEKAEDNLFEGKIDIKTFEKGKGRYVRKITELEFELSEIKSTGVKFMTRIKESLAISQNLSKLWNDSTLEVRQQLLGSIFPEKIYFEKNKCRTTRINSVLESILMVTSQLEGNEKGKVESIFNFSHRVPGMGVEPTRP